MTKELLPFDTLSFLSKENANRVVDRVMMNTYVNRPDLVVMTEKEIKKKKLLSLIHIFAMQGATFPILGVLV